MQVKKSDKYLIGACIGLIFLFFSSIIIVTFTRQILVKHMGMQNIFTDFIFMDHDAFNNGDEFNGDELQERGAKSEIDWAELYPFTFDDVPLSTEGTTQRSWTEKIEEKIDGVKSKVEFYCSKALFGYKNFVEQSKSYEKFIGWNFAPFGEYNGVVEMSSGYFTSYEEEKDVTDHANSLIELNEFCKDNGCEFLYIQAPHKVCEYDDSQISGSSDFSNQNANKMISIIEDAGVDVFDIRDVIHNEDFIHHELFYRTDHHWLTTTGLWAAQKTLEYCNVNYNFNAEISRLDLDRFEKKLYPEWFLGSQGKKVTLAHTEPDDFVLLYPEYKTKFHYYVPDELVDEEGDYSIVYDMRQIEEKDLYGSNPYGGCNYGDQPLIQIQNLLNADDNKILIIHDSFGDCFISCLALCEAEVDSLDVRHFNGSVKNYIQSTNPDIVMVMYNAGVVGDEIDWKSHESMFDFR